MAPRVGLPRFCTLPAAFFLATSRLKVRSVYIAGSFSERRRLRDSGIALRQECPALPLTLRRRVRMKTAAECLTQALHCEGMARAAEDEIDRFCLLATASIWRRLAVADAPRAPIVGPPYLPPV